MAIKSKRYVIVGNGAAGTMAAEQLKKDDPHCRVDLFGSEPYPLYNRVALPPFLKGSVRQKKVLMRTVEDHRTRGINLHLETAIESIEADEKVAITSKGRSFPYDALLVATGGRPNPLPAEGARGTRHIYNFQTLDDAKDIIARVKTSKTGVVIGGSFIAYELAEGFQKRGLNTVWIMRGPYFLRRILDEDGGALVDRIAKDHGVVMMYGQEVKEVKANGGEVQSIVTTSGQQIDADLVGVGLGLKLNTQLVQNSGAKVNYGIRTDQYLRTTDPSIFAAGDVAEFYDPLLQNHHTMGTWNNAVSHGKTAAINMSGGATPYETVPTYTSGLFDTKLAVIGATPENNPEVESISIVDTKERNYRRLFFLGGRVVGAVLIGDMRPRRRIMQMMKSREPMESKREKEAALHI